MSDEVERRVFQLLGHPTHSPYGNPIPGLAELGKPGSEPDGQEQSLASVPADAAVVVRRICESVQTDTTMLHQLHAAGIDPGAKVSVTHHNGSVVVDRGGEQVRLPRQVAERVFVAAT